MHTRTRILLLLLVGESGWLFEYSDPVFYLDVLISKSLQALSCDNPDVWRGSFYLQSKKNKKPKEGKSTISRHWFV